MLRHHRWMAPALVAVLLLSGCAPALGSEPAAESAAPAVSDTCSFGEVYEYDASPSPRTTQEALEHLLEFYRDPPSAEPLPGFEFDELNATLRVRTLEALLVALPEAELAAAGSGYFTVTDPGDPVSLGSADISRQFDGGWHVDMMTVVAFVDDDPRCG